MFKDKLLFKKLGSILFFVGIFILPSMFFFAAILLLLSGILGSFLHRDKYLKDNFNKSFFACGILIFISVLTHLTNINNPYSEILDSNLSLIGVFNWLPFFWLFWALQPYINSKAKRKKTALILVAGTFPVLVSGFGQYFFNWTGPLETLNGLIIWYQRPLGNHGLTGPFNNQNYAGAWLSLIWPFSIALVIEKTNNNYKKAISIIFLFAIGLAAILTNSRNAWGSILLSLPLVIGTSSLYWLIPILFLISLAITITSHEILTGEVQEAFRNIIPRKIWMEFTQKVNITRSDIFLSSLKVSLINPMFGLGAASFPIIYELQNNIWRGHPHNLILELAVSYGYPATILFFINIILILFYSSKVIFLDKSKDHKQTPFEKAWWVSIFIFLISQSVDVQYFDGRVSIVFWLLLSGLRNMIIENKSEDIAY